MKNFSYWPSLCVFSLLLLATLVPKVVWAQEQRVKRAEVSSSPSSLKLSVGLGMGVFSEELAYEAGDFRASQERGLWQTRLDVGLVYQWGEWLGAKFLGQSSLGLGFVLVEGDLPLYVTQQAALEWELGAGFRAGTGAQLGVVWNVSTPSQSFANLGPYFSLGWRALEFGYSPSVVWGLAREETPVFLGQRTRGLSTGSIAHTLSTRIRWSL